MCAGIVIRIIINIPLWAVKAFIFLLSLIINLDHETWDDKVVNGLDFIANSVLQVPFFLMTVMGSITPALDHLFMDSLRWVDQTYIQKHKSDDPTKLRAMYYPMLQMYSTHDNFEKREKRGPLDRVLLYVGRYGRRAGISLTIYALTFLPVVGRFVLPAASLYTFNKAVGPVPAVAVFACGLVVPKRYMVSFLQTYFSSRSLMRHLLEPYFTRIRFSKQQKRIWFIDRSGVLFGFSAAFTIMVNIPLLGVLIYGIAEASTAYLITKITEPPPPPGDNKEFIESEVRWKNKHLFLNLPMDKLDEFNAKIIDREEQRSRDRVQAIPGKKYT